MGHAAFHHIEIATEDLARSCDFYATILGFVVGDPPKPLPAETMQWLFDAAGRPVIHLVQEEGPLADGTVRHLALQCTDKAQVTAQLEAIGTPYEIVDTRGAPFDLIFARDPSGVMLELRFHHAEA